MPGTKKLGGRRGASGKKNGSVWKILIVVLLFVLSVWLFLGYQFYLSLLQKSQKEQQASVEIIRPPKVTTPAVENQEESAKAISIAKPVDQTKKDSHTFPPKFPITDRSHAFAQETIDMCNRAMWHTLETTTIVLPENETFIHTGDIDDLWLRDSAGQIHPLLVPFDNGKSLVQQDPRLARVVSGLIKRSAMYIRHDPYANAFRIDDSYKFSAAQKQLGRHDLISTWNYELDSACYYIRMIYYFYKSLPDHEVLRLQSVHEAISIMLDLWIAEQDHEGDAFPTGPLLDCKNCGKPYRYPGLPRTGKGSPVARTGMTWTGFRPSDDECRYGYLIPANMFAVVVLKYVEELAPILWDDEGMAAKAKKLGGEIEEGIQQYSIVKHPKYGRIYAYEVDGLGHSFLMDDANVPSLMSIPYLGYNYDPEVYANTRRFILSSDNPTYQKGTNPFTGAIEGYGSPHMSKAIRNNIWPMSLVVQALSSSDTAEKLRLIDKLVHATGDTGWMHESFDVGNPKKFTRKWFCWADSLFAELVLTMTSACPSSQYKIMEWRDPLQVPGGKFAK